MTHPSGMLDETHEPARRSWVESASSHAVFPLQNLPFGVFRPPPESARGGVAIGEEIFDLKRAVEAGLFTGIAEEAARAAAGPTLNGWMSLGRRSRVELRRRLFELLADDGAQRHKAQGLAGKLLHPASACVMQMPAAVGAYTDFFAGIHHAYNGGVRNRRNPPLLPNYKYVPVGYHSRASSIVVSGAAVRRPHGQVRTESGPPGLTPSRKLDFELELGVWIGPGNALGEPVPIAAAGEQIVGLCMLNDWSARDIQGWEMAPLGPFLSKNFCTTISPWIVTVEALAPFRKAQPPRPEGDPRPLPYLLDDADQAAGAFDIGIEALIRTERMRAVGLPAQRLSASNVSHLYWTLAQLVAHHTCGGCNLQAGDLFGSGTISAPDRSGWGSFSELSDGGDTPLEVRSGEARTFLEDGDELILRASASRPGYATIGFGDCAGRIAPALQRALP